MEFEISGLLYYEKKRTKKSTFTHDNIVVDYKLTMDLEKCKRILAQYYRRLLQVYLCSCLTTYNLSVFSSGKMYDSFQRHKFYAEFEKFVFDQL